MQSPMAYCPVVGFLAQLVTQSTFMLLHSGQWRFAILVVSVLGPSSVASFAISIVLSFPAVPMGPGTNSTSFNSCQEGLL